MKRSINFQLGVMVGEYIVETQLPTLSTDMLRTSTVIEVDEELTKEWNRRDEEWKEEAWGKGRNKEKATKIFYKNLDWYKANIEAEYLKEEIRVLVPNVKPTDEKQFFEGVEFALWNSDLSHYGDAEFSDEYEEFFARRGITLHKSKYEPQPKG